MYSAPDMWDPAKQRTLKKVEHLKKHAMFRRWAPLLIYRSLKEPFRLKKTFSSFSAHSSRNSKEGRKGHFQFYRFFVLARGPFARMYNIEGMRAAHARYLNRLVKNRLLPLTGPSAEASRARPLRIRKPVNGPRETAPRSRARRVFFLRSYMIYENGSRWPRGALRNSGPESWKGG